MKNGIFGKGLVFVIIVLFIGINITPTVGGLSIEKRVSTGVKNSYMPINTRGNTLYVGGSGPGNFSHIQDAVDNATDGDTVFVYDDSSPYYEHVVVDKSINLIGENKNTTIIDGSGSGTVVLLAVSSVTVSGFTIQNSGGTIFDAGVKIETNQNVIIGNIIKNNDVLYSLIILGSLNTITFNIFRDNTGIGLMIAGDSNTIAFNTIINNEVGVTVEYSRYNKIYENYIANNGEGIEITPGMIPSTKATLFFDGEYQNDIYRNTIINNDLGILIFYFWDTNVFENYLAGNSYAIYLYAGWYGSCINNNIYQNNINGNDYGISLEANGLYGTIAYNNIFENNITSGKVGINLICTEGEVWGSIVGFNNISKNNITYNEQGINIYQKYKGKVRNNAIYQNNFIGNIQHASDEGWNTWYNATAKMGNYWDDYAGEDILPPYGVGDTPYYIDPHPLINKDKYPLMKPYPNAYSNQASQIQSNSQQNSQSPQSNPSPKINRIVNPVASQVVSSKLIN